MIDDRIEELRIEEIVDPERVSEQQLDAEHQKTGDDGYRHKALPDDRQLPPEHVRDQHQHGYHAELDDRFPNAVRRVEDRLDLLRRHDHS